MAAPKSYRIRLEPYSQGAIGGSNTIKQGVPSSKALNAPHDVHIQASEAQILNLMHYIGLIRGGADTSSVETAIGLLSV